MMVMQVVKIRFILFFFSSMKNAEKRGYVVGAFNVYNMEGVDAVVAAAEEERSPAILQMYVKNFGSCEDMGPGSFPVEEVHKISVLDIRLSNADRHAGNILVNRDEEGQIMLIPIDHGYCLPSNFEDCTFDWLYWPQARQPYSPQTIEYINSLNAEEDLRLLNLHGWNVPPECARLFLVSTMVLKKGVKKGLTPFAIGSIMCRETLKKESLIELMVQEAEESLLPGSSEAAFLEAISSVMDRKLDKLSSKSTP